VQQWGQMAGKVCASVCVCGGGGGAAPVLASDPLVKQSCRAWQPELTYGLTSTSPGGRQEARGGATLSSTGEGRAAEELRAWGSYELGRPSPSVPDDKPLVLVLSPHLGSSGSGSGAYPCYSKPNARPGAHLKSSAY
jgi:hypothetical protein